MRRSFAKTGLPKLCAKAHHSERDEHPDRFPDRLCSDRDIVARFVCILLRLKRRHFSASIFDGSSALPETPEPRESVLPWVVSVHRTNP
jgi:hypothetical protein